MDEIKPVKPMKPEWMVVMIFLVNQQVWVGRELGFLAGLVVAVAGIFCAYKAMNF